MAKGEQTSADLIRRARERQADGGPLLTKERTVNERKGALYGNLTEEGRDIVGFRPGTDIYVHVFRDGVVILPGGDSNDE